jgi:hypothetical protein
VKRHRVLAVDFDSRAWLLSQEIQEHWEETVKALHRANREQTLAGLQHQYGPWQFEAKLQNFLDIGPKAFSILAFHNRFFEQCRRAFVVGAYYPALTGACALGERLLNHLILLLRDDFKASPQYKYVYRKESFDNWQTVIDALEAWGVLLPETVGHFRRLHAVRNRAIHFRPETDTNDRPLALEAIKVLSDIIASQFSGFGPQPWFLGGVPGEIYLKKEAELTPFIRKVYLPNCLLVGPFHVVEAIDPDGRMIVRDDAEYEERQITDEEFCRLRTKGKEPNAASS